jgi:hypothetical protein
MPEFNPHAKLLIFGFGITSESMSTGGSLVAFAEKHGLLGDCPDSDTRSMVAAMLGGFELEKVCGCNIYIAVPFSQVISFQDRRWRHHQTVLLQSAASPRPTFMTSLHFDSVCTSFVVSFYLDSSCPYCCSILLILSIICSRLSQMQCKSRCTPINHPAVHLKPQLRPTPWP